MVKLLGTGSFGEVYLTEHINLNVFRAVKCIIKSPDFISIARHEADILKNLRHPDIPIIYDIEEDTDYLYIVEEYLEGMSLKSFISNNKSISNKEIIILIVQLCEIVEYLHENGIFHNDIKPDNIIIDNNNIKLLDYGSAVVSGTKNITRTGTIKYAAPELYGEEIIRAGSDIYSIGVVMLFLKTGSENVRSVAEIHPQILQQIITKCLNHSENGRVKSVKDLHKQLLKIIKNKSVSKVRKIISFAGAYSHAGSTHCAFMAAYVLRNSGYKVLVKENNRSHDFMRIIEAEKQVIFSSGIISMNGIYIQPCYDRYVETDDKGFDYIIRDYGEVTSTNSMEIKAADCICIVTGAKPYELEKLNKVQTLLDSGRSHILVNFASGKNFKLAVCKYKIINPVRVPYVTNPKEIREKRRYFE